MKVSQVKKGRSMKFSYRSRDDEREENDVTCAKQKDRVSEEQA